MSIIIKSSCFHHIQSSMPTKDGQATMQICRHRIVSESSPCWSLPSSLALTLTVSCVSDWFLKHFQFVLKLVFLLTTLIEMMECEAQTDTNTILLHLMSSSAQQLLPCWFFTMSVRLSKFNVHRENLHLRTRFSQWMTQQLSSNFSCHVLSPYFPWDLPLTSCQELH